MKTTGSMLSRLRALALAGFAALWGVGPVLSGESLAVGAAAPAFELPGSDGKTYRLKELTGERAVVVAWYPKAFTGGWTAQCKSLRESGAAIREYDVAYFAASTDDPETNAKFAKSLELDYPILSDPGKEIAGALGVLEPEGRYALRHTIYIGADGKVLYVDRKVNPKTAGADTVARLEELGVPKKK